MHIKLTDFGTAHRYYNNSILYDTNKTTGTQSYSSPEQFNEIYTATSDIWSYGVTLFSLNTFSQFSNKSLEDISNHEIRKKIGDCSFSEDFADFLLSCINIHSYKRKSIDYLLKHKWLSD